jgi:hypothetical protein
MSGTVGGRETEFADWRSQAELGNEGKKEKKEQPAAE